jgi:hypothetical protein
MNGAIMWGKTTMSRNGTTGSRDLLVLIKVELMLAYYTSIYGEPIESEDFRSRAYQARRLS